MLMKKVSLLALCVAAGAGPALSANYVIEPVAVSGDPAPDLTGFAFVNVDSIVVNEDGDTAFLANTACPRQSMYTPTAPPGAA